MPQIPKDKALDSTGALLSEGYRFIAERCRRYRSDLFETRLMLSRAVCISGEEAARMFYEPGRFTRRGATPAITVRLLQDKGSVQMLDGAAHRHRKAMFVSLMTPEGVARLANRFETLWRGRIAAWAARDSVVLSDEAGDLLCRAVCAWAGIPLDDAAAAARTREFAAMIDGAGSVGPRAWRGLLLRRRTERWARGVIEAVRDGTLPVPEGSPVRVIAAHHAPDGALLPPGTAAVELLNLLRPTVAVGRFITFAAHALHRHPQWRERLDGGDEAELECFVQEVRRLYPFFPFVGGRVMRPFEWRGRHFARGEWVLLDLYGTDHDPRLWAAPDEFRPERFRQWDGSAFDFIPQGGGDIGEGHRCPGERIAIELTKRAVRLLASAMRYEVPAQDLTIDLARFPAIPASRFLIRGVRPVE